MKVILQKSVPKVGKKGDVVEVNDGYAHNALVPRKLAIIATPAAIAQRDREIKNTKEEIAIRHALLERAINDLAEHKVVMKVRANDQGNIFAKVHALDIAQYLKDQHRILIDPKCVHLSDGPIKKLGTYEIPLVDEGHTVTFTLELVNEKISP